MSVLVYIFYRKFSVSFPTHRRHFEYVIPPETEIQNMFFYKEMVPSIEMVVVDDIVFDAMM